MESRMKVYVLLTKYDYEGSELEEVFFSEEDALKYYLDDIRCKGDGWEIVEKEVK
jgi:hypothetical protein